MSVFPIPAVFRAEPAESSPAAAGEARTAEEGEDGTLKLTRRLVAGEEEAWRELHAAYAPRLWRYLLVAARGDEEAATEGLQRAFVRATRYARNFETEEALWGWLTLLARQTLADGRRAEGRWRAFLRRFTGERPAASEPPPHTTAEDTLSASLDAVWPDLDAEDRALLEQKYHESRSVRDLAAAAGVTEKTIESRLTRARARLRERMLRHLKS